MHLDPATKEIQNLLWEQQKLTHGPSVMTLSMKQSNHHAPAPNVASKSNKATSSDLLRALYSMLIITFTSRIAFIAKPLTSDSRQSRSHHGPEHNVHSIKLRQVSCHLHVFDMRAEDVAFCYEGRQLQRSVCDSGLSEQNQYAVCRHSGSEPNTTDTHPSYSWSLATCWDDSLIDQSRPATQARLPTHAWLIRHPRDFHHTHLLLFIPHFLVFLRTSSCWEHLEIGWFHHVLFHLGTVASRPH